MKVDVCDHDYAPCPFCDTLPGRDGKVLPCGCPADTPLSVIGPVARCLECNRIITL